MRALGATKVVIGDLTVEFGPSADSDTAMSGDAETDDDEEEYDPAHAHVLSGTNRSADLPQYALFKEDWRLANDRPTPLDQSDRLKSWVNTPPLSAFTKR